MPDVLLGATAAGTGIAVYAAVTTELVREVRERHDLSPTVTAALGRLTTGAVLFGASLKGSERISLQVSGDGPAGAMTTDAWLLDGGAAIGARGYTRNPLAELPVDERGKFAVGRLVGSGMLQVTKSYEVGQPYVGVVPLQTGEIAEDLAYYLAHSEQIPSIVALGVLANPDGVVAAGGLIAQALPDAPDNALESIERRALEMPSITSLVRHNPTPEHLLRALLGADVELRARREMPVRFACRCTREKVETALSGLGADGLRRLREERGSAEATCEFCGRRYELSDAELEALAERVERAKS
ncbi:MAG TPA: Hsp33 family molecular chaperone HslO [Candidatus Tumulicola sp.]|jgi:molecular chaperone Hsp33